MIRCCLCPTGEGIHTESRKSLEFGRQSFHFCDSCWSELDRQKKNIDPEICQRYKVFLLFVLAGVPVAPAIRR